MPDYSEWRMHQDDLDLKSLLDFDSCSCIRFGLLKVSLALKQECKVISYARSLGMNIHKYLQMNLARFLKVVQLGHRYLVARKDYQIIF